MVAIENFNRTDKCQQREIRSSVFNSSDYMVERKKKEKSDEGIISETQLVFIAMRICTDRRYHSDLKNMLADVSIRIVLRHQCNPF